MEERGRAWREWKWPLFLFFLGFNIYVNRRLLFSARSIWRQPADLNVTGPHLGSYCPFPSWELSQASGLGWRRGMCQGDALEPVQHHLFNLLLSGTLVACSVLNSSGTSLLALLAASWDLSHLKVLFVKFFIFSTRNLRSCFCCFFPPVSHWGTLCCCVRGQEAQATLWRALRAT